MGKKLQKHFYILLIKKNLSINKLQMLENNFTHFSFLQIRLC